MASSSSSWTQQKKRLLRPIPRQAELEEGQIPTASPLEEGEIPTTSPAYKVELYWSVNDDNDNDEGRKGHYITQLSPLEFNGRPAQCMIPYHDDPRNRQQLLIALWIAFLVRHNVYDYDDEAHNDETITICSRVENHHSQLTHSRSMQEQPYAQTQNIPVMEFLSNMYHDNGMEVHLADVPIIAVFTPLG